MAEENVKIAKEWMSVCGHIELTKAQKKRKAKGLSIYEKDEQVRPYVFSKGEFV